MDLDFHGRPEFSAELAAVYLSLSRDWPLYLLLDFYKAYRACVRGKSSVSASRPRPCLPGKTAVQAEACGIPPRPPVCPEMNRPFLLAACGLMERGNRRSPGPWRRPWLDLAPLRPRAEGVGRPAPGERRYDPFQKGLYAPPCRKDYQALFARAEALLLGGSSVILDASFPRERDRSAALDLAQRMGADFLLLECRATTRPSASGWKPP